MSKDTRNYYERELEQINFNGEHPAKILIGSEGKTTHTLDVNRESAAALVSKLCAVFFVDLTLAAPPKPAPVEPAQPISYTLGRDANGNKTLRVRNGEGHGYTIQTNGNLPQTHRYGICEATAGEVCDYTSQCGTKRQKVILGL